MKSPGHDRIYKLLEIESAIAVAVMESDQKLTVFLCNLVAQLHKDLSQVPPIYRLVIIFVEKTEDLDELFVLFCFFDSFGHKVAELVEIDSATVIVICIFDHLAHFFLGGVLAKRSHNCAELLDRDCFVAIDIEHFKNTPEILNLLLGQITTQRVHLLSRDSILIFIVIILRLVNLFATGRIEQIFLDHLSFSFSKF